MLDRLIVFLILAAIPVLWGSIEYASGDGGGILLIAFGIAAGIYGARQDVPRP